ncbi:MAG: tRNA lysidine(34) synthetase TilS [Gallionella sp.]
MSSVNLLERVATLTSPLIPAGRSILIGLSGGVDSVVLLHLLHQLAPRYDWKLSALHVHHGISPNADSWADFCAKLCATLLIPLQLEQVDIAPLRTQGIEAAARSFRYAAFAKQTCDFVALAHHADDQVETLLLQLLRGAGVRGASAMPVLRAATPDVVRPLLQSSRQEIVSYAVAHNLAWIEDESNRDEYYPRNFLRQRLLPLLSEKFPAYRDTLTRSAQNFAEASHLLDELAQLDAMRAITDCTLDVALMQALSPPRAKNLLRYFLSLCGAPMPHFVQLNDMLLQLGSARADAALCVRFGGGGWQLRRYQGQVYVMRALGVLDDQFELAWQGEEKLAWPLLNATLMFQPCVAAGVSVAKLRRANVTLRLRQGGESLRPAANAATRTLKNLLQEHAVLPWQRERWPLLFCGDELVCVPGVGIAAAFQAAADEAGITLVLNTSSRISLAR